MGNASGANGQRLWVLDESGGSPKPISPEGVDGRLTGAISADGKRVAAVDPQGKLVIYSLEGGEALAVPGVTVGDRPLHWTGDGKNLLVARWDSPNVVYKLELSSGKRQLFRTLPVPDGLRGEDLGTPIFSADFKSYMNSYSRIASDLYVVEGLK